MTEAAFTADSIAKMIAAYESVWPHDLLMKAHFARLCLLCMDRPDNWHPVPEKLNKAALSDFAAAYAEWRGA